MTDTTKRIQINTKEAPAAIGPYSQAIQTSGMLFCSGQIPLNPETMEMVPGDVTMQARQVLKNLKAVLLAGGSTPSKVVKTTIFLTDLSAFALVNKEYEHFFQAEAPGVAAPARSTVEVSALPKGAQVEIEAIALI
jgi:2-iminobutanoate/2-iminopropanoate deaminase